MPPLHSVQPIINSAAALQIAPVLIAPQHSVHSQPAAKLPRPKRKEYERRVSVNKGMSVDSVKVLINEDIRQGLAKLGKPSSSGRASRWFQDGLYFLQTQLNDDTKNIAKNDIMISCCLLLLLFLLLLLLPPPSLFSFFLFASVALRATTSLPPLRGIFLTRRVSF